jgi:hypothetical protein
MILRERRTINSQPTESAHSNPSLLQQALTGCWTGDPARIGMQFESICFGPGDALEAHIVTMCVRGFCPSVESIGTFALLSGERLLLTLDGIGQEFVAWESDERLYLREPISDMTKSYSRKSDE